MKNTETVQEKQKESYGETMSNSKQRVERTLKS